jgi:predicted transcriptional regulator
MSTGGDTWRPADRAQSVCGLGPLEAAILRIVWDRGQVTVRDVYEELRQRRRTAYTTVLTTFRSLVRKGLVSEDRGQRAHRYSALVSDRDVSIALLDMIVDTLLNGDATPLLDNLQLRAQDDP